MFLYPTPPEKKLGMGGGYTEIALSICPDVCLCRFVPAHIFSLLWHWLTIVGTWVYHHEMMCHVHSWSWYYFNLWPQCQIIRVFNMSLCLASNLFYCFDIGLITIFGSWVYLHERMCRVQLWYWYKADLWPQGQIYKVFDMLWPQFFVLWLSHTIFGTWVHQHGTMCHIHSWPLYDLDLWPYYQIYIFTMNLCLGKIVFAFWHRHTKFDLWPICGWWGESLGSFTHSF